MTNTVVLGSPAPMTDLEISYSLWRPWWTGLPYSVISPSSLTPDSDASHWSLILSLSQTFQSILTSSCFFRECNEYNAERLCS